MCVCVCVCVEGCVCVCIKERGREEKNRKMVCVAPGLPLTLGMTYQTLKANN